MSLMLAVLLAAPPATPSPSPTPKAPMAILLAKPANDAAPPTGGSLAEVAKRIKLRLPADRPRVLNNDSVKQLSEGVELTSGPSGRGGVLGGGEHASPEGEKAMWQQRYLTALSRVAQLEAEVKRLEAEANRLQKEFFAHDDPAQRDGVIKPAWDKALADLRQAQSDLEQARNQPDEVLNAARKAGALPGWFRGLDQRVGESQIGSPATAPASGSSSTSPPIPPTPRPTPTPRLRPRPS